jgi:hypothetical protein
MLSKLSGDEVVKGLINDYTKIREEFRELLRNDGFKWQRGWKRENMFGMEGVWLSYVLKSSIRIRWGKVNPSAIVYVGAEYFEKIEKFIDSYEIVAGFSTPNHDYDRLNVTNRTDNASDDVVEILIE